MKFSSVTSKLIFAKELQVNNTSEVKTGDVVQCEVLTINPRYPHLELANGEMVALEIGDIIIGAIGTRQALRGFVGYPPTNLNADCKLSLLNMGGVIGCCVDSAAGLGEPSQLKYLGTVTDEKGIININRSTLPAAHNTQHHRPILLVLGTCMNVGKTSNATNLIQAATKAGYQVGAAKIAGVAAIKDLVSFKNAGAIDIKSFLDCGLPSTVDTDNLVPIVKNIIQALEGDLLVIELGDGIMGHYKVETVLTDKDFMSSITAIVVCATDLAAAYGAKHYLQDLGIKIDILSGPATDNISGSNYIEEKFGVPAINGYKYPDKLFTTSIARWEKQYV